jgi:hypothetical protein
MSDHSHVDPVVSGRPYTVTAVNDSAPGCLDDFVARPVVAVTVEARDQVVEIHGAAHLGDGDVVVHEKDCDGTGKDVRTWQIRPADNGFAAVQKPIDGT